MLQKRFYWILPLTLFSIFLFIIAGCEDDEPLTYTLSIFVNPQEGGTAEGKGSYKAGEEVCLTAVANEGYQFLNWSDAGDEVVSTENEFVYTMPGMDVTLTTNFIIEDGTAGSVTDIDGNEYKTVKIGGKEWMAENLRTTRYNDGTDIPSGLSDDEWEETDEGAYAVHPHRDVEGIDSEAEMADTYGKLYNWYAVDNDRGLCPEGWQVFSAFDWEELVDYLMSSYDDLGPENIGNILKSCRQVGSPLGGECNTEEHPRWEAHDVHYGTDEFGFSALPGGSRKSYGEFTNYVGFHGRFWTSTQTEPTQAARWYLQYDSSTMHWDSNVYKEAGLSVRCVKY